MEGVDKTTIESLYHSYWEVLFKYVVHVLRDENDAGDVVQDVFITLWEQRDKLAHIDNPKAYLFTMARNRALRFIATYQHRQRFIESLGHFLQDEQYVDSVDSRIAHAELDDTLTKQMEKLPPRMREVFQLSRYEQLSHREIAKKLDIAENTVKKQVNYALKVLRAGLKDYLAALILFLSSL